MGRNKRRWLALGLAGMMTLGLTACGSSDSGSSDSGSESTGESASAESESSGEKEDLVLIFMKTETDDKLQEMLHEKFDDKYNLTIKILDQTALEQTVKTAATAGEQVDVVMYWPNQMNSFTSVDLATDLTEYVDDEWKAQFTDESVLDIGTYDGKIYNLPYNSVYPLIIANTDITDAAGVTLPEDGSWTWDDFLAACQQVQEKTGKFGACIDESVACWTIRNAYMQCWDTDEELDAWNAGEVSFKDDKIVEATEMVADAFNNNVFYPGEGALAVTGDQSIAAFTQGEYAFMFAVNGSVATNLEKTGIENYKIMDWPSMGTNPTDPLLGGCDGYFIPTCTKNLEGALEVLKYLTGPELATMRAEAGAVVTCKTSEDANVDGELMSQVSRRTSSVYPTEIINIDAELAQYIMYQMPANYINNGESALDDMEAMRQAAMGSE